ncbi:D-methionine transport system ATP-binding protein [Candidatus Pantoea symbiotica]|uniref:D-methionine transport system ATP-binding protein n=1 Tax=Candidatus Pantoea symbiotica TaxID=1884370 RepID=A0A1I3YVC5_9GAMM|nr:MULTISPECIES: ATP-binding cassette domain-containing protein [Pantoea]KAJ9430557.1 ATP-binding cassette domain-containing protein [Pantoea sp. YR343]MRT25866.1 ATP-binding cassette domain-containing protein [Enterobacteriaceae bacterium RIT697]SFK35824.1 D-methionine transport system ATP-binding protein [Pantoea symbiotica]SFU87639.1 D-methionine transport system ATP-binding protein [Pantoea sp. YR525]
MVSLTLPGERDALLSPTAETAGKIHVQIRGLSKRYPGQTQDALKEVDLQVKRGEIFGIIGRSGAGKSTLIRCLNRLENPTRGQVVIDGIDLGTLSDRQLVDWRRGTGMIFQHFNLLSAKTVRENIELPMKVAGVPVAQRRRKVDELLALVGLEQRQHAWPAQLSGGQKQRVGIARALVHDPELLLCDEATSALDPETTRSILALLKKINQQRHITIVLITHEMDVVHDLCHQVAVIDQGEIIERGPVWQVYSDPQQETTRQLLNPQFSALPEAIQPLLTPTRQRGDSRLLVRLRYTGQGAQPDLAALSARVGGELTLIYSAVEWVDSKPTGQMLLLLDAQHDADAARKRLTPIADQLEIPGYVTGY